MFRWHIAKNLNKTNQPCQTRKNKKLAVGIDSALIGKD
jgi:hypothetical protein